MKEMKTFFKHMVDSAVIYVADKYGFGDEEDVLKKELRTLQYDHMLEKTKKMDGALEEIHELKNEVKRLTEEKMITLEREVQRLQFENQQYRLGTNQALAIQQPLLSFAEVERFAYKEAHIKYVLTNGSAHVSPMEESELLGHLHTECADLNFSVLGENLAIVVNKIGDYEVQNFLLTDFISMDTLRDLNKHSYNAKRTIY